MLNIQRVAVLGAGVMGAQIAALLCESNLDVLLFDLPSEGQVPSAIAEAGIARLAQLKPSPLSTSGIEQQIIPCNYRDDLAKLQHCDLVVEAVAEILSVKQSLYQQILPYLSADAILVSNTSGLSINALAQGLPADLASKFCGAHFFNPPRYMSLLELIPATNTDKSVLDALQSFFIQQLAREVVIAKDTPNFIANRVGVFALLSTMHHAQAFGLTPDTVDALMGTLVGRPKSATYRTVDVIGLDTMAKVVETMHTHLQDDPWHGQFCLPDWLHGLISQGALGQKTGVGIYRKTTGVIQYWSQHRQDYVDAVAGVSPAVQKCFDNPQPSQWLPALFHSEDQQARFLSACFSDLFMYCATHLPAIATSTQDIDRALRWGFGWQQGPFALWQQAGIADIGAAVTQQTGHKLPDWLQGVTAFT